MDSSKEILKNNKKRLILLYKRKILADMLYEKKECSDEEYKWHMNEINRKCEEIEMQNNFVLGNGFKINEA